MAAVKRLPYRALEDPNQRDSILEDYHGLCVEIGRRLNVYELEEDDPVLEEMGDNLNILTSEDTDISLDGDDPQVVAHHISRAHAAHSEGHISLRATTEYAELIQYLQRNGHGETLQQF